MKKQACMICGQEKNGTDIKEDFVLRFMRWFKTNVTKNAKGYRIVVCDDCAAKYKKQRDKYVRRRAMYVGLGIVFTVALVYATMASNIFALIYGLGMTIFLYLLSFVSYMPAVQDESKINLAAAQKKQNK